MAFYALFSGLLDDFEFTNNIKFCLLYPGMYMNNERKKNLFTLRFVFKQ